MENMTLALPNQLTPEQAPRVANALLMDRANLSFLSTMIEAAGLVPLEKNVRPEVAKARVMAKIVGGASYGFDPIQSQENLHIINGKITLSARGMSQLLHRGGRYQTKQIYLNETGCKLEVYKNADSKWHLLGFVEWTLKDAERAGLTDGPNAHMWRKYPADMSFARCISRVIKRFAPEVLDGQAIQYDLAKKETAPEPEQPAGQTPNVVEGSFPAFDPTEAEAAAIGAGDEESGIVDSDTIREELTALCAQLNAQGDDIKWSQKQLNEYAKELCGGSVNTLEFAALVALRDDLAERLAGLD